MRYHEIIYLPVSSHYCSDYKTAQKFVNFTVSERQKSKKKLLKKGRLDCRNLTSYSFSGSGFGVASFWDLQINIQDNKLHVIIGNYPFILQILFIISHIDQLLRFFICKNRRNDPTVCLHVLLAYMKYQITVISSLLKTDFFYLIKLIGIKFRIISGIP